MTTVTLLVGNPKPASRTLELGLRVVDALFGIEPTIVDLAAVDDHAALVDAVAASDVLVVASPTYKATYTALLASFLQRYPAGALKDVVAIPVMTGGDATHSLAPDTHLRPLLLELGAIMPTRSLYFMMGDLEREDEIVRAWAADARAAFARVARLV